MRGIRIPKISRAVPKPKFYLDESVNVWVADVLGLKHHVQTAEDARLLGRGDPDHFAHCWRHGRVLVTHDFDFFDYKNPDLPDTRNPGVIVFDCDSGNSAAIEAIIAYLPRLSDLVGNRGWKHTRMVVTPAGRVILRRRNRNSGADEIEHYRLDDRRFFLRDTPGRSKRRLLPRQPRSRGPL
jgi:predicted nuclease of predicted toxin-antitoxin system